jgi:hypothetical protein
MKARLTDRDVRILAKLAVARWLTTAQIQRMYFSDATLNAVQKRLRRLSDAGYLRSHREHPTSEAVHSVGPKGKAIVEEKGIQATIGEDVPGQLDHLLGVNAIRIDLETSGEHIVFFFGYFQLADLGWKYQIVPDAVFAVRNSDRRTFLVEYDRGTEPLDKLVSKLERYDSGLSEFPFEAVLIITERSRHLEVLSRELRRKGLAVAVLAATTEEVNKAGFFKSDFVELPGTGRRRLLVRPGTDAED